MLLFGSFSKCCMPIYIAVSVQILDWTVLGCFGLDGSSEMISRCEDHHLSHGIISKRGSHPFRLYNARPHAGIQSVCTAPSLRQEQMNSEFRSKENAGLWLIWERLLLTTTWGLSMTASTTAEDRQNHSNKIFIHRWCKI